MPSELSRRLDEFRTKNKVVPAIQKVSFLFDPTRAAGLDVLSLAVIAKKSLFELIKLEPSLSVFEDLFDGTGKSVDFLSQEEHAELKSRISQLLMLLSAHMKSLDCQHLPGGFIGAEQSGFYTLPPLQLLWRGLACFLLRSSRLAVN